MSFLSTVQLRCDSCGIVLVEARDLVGDQLQSARYKLQRIFDKDFGMTTKRRLRRTRHLCRPCADGPTSHDTPNQRQ